MNVSASKILNQLNRKKSVFVLRKNPHTSLFPKIIDKIDEIIKNLYPVIYKHNK